MLPIVSIVNFWLLCINHTLNFAILTHLVLWVALPPSVPVTRHSHRLSTSHSFIPGLKPFLQILPTVASLFSSGLTPLIPRTVYRYFWAYQFLLFSFLFSTFLFLVSCSRLSCRISAFECTFKKHLILYHSYHSFCRCCFIFNAVNWQLGPFCRLPAASPGGG